MIHYSAPISQQREKLLLRPSLLTCSDEANGNFTTGTVHPKSASCPVLKHKQNKYTQNDYQRNPPIKTLFSQIQDLGSALSLEGPSKLGPVGCISTSSVPCIFFVGVDFLLTFRSPKR